MPKFSFKLPYLKISDINEQEPSNTIGGIKIALSSEVDKAERGGKINTTPAEKEKRNVNKSLS